MFKRTLDIITEYWKSIVFLIFAGVFIYAGFELQWDKQIVTGLVVLAGIISNAFAGVVGLVTLVPIIGPLIVKILSIPVFWLLNAGGYFVSIFFVKRGYGSSVVQSRVLTVVLLVGVVLGFILGKLL